MKIAGGEHVPLHTDAEYHWFTRIRVHIPVVTDPAVRFYCGSRSAHLSAGEAWIFDNSRPHRVENSSATSRIHLVFDTQGSKEFWDKVKATNDTTPFVPYRQQIDARVPLEPYCFEVLTPQDIHQLTTDIAAEAKHLTATLGRFRDRWQKTFAQYGHTRAGELAYWQLIEDLKAVLRDVCLDEQARYAARMIGSMLKTTNRSVIPRRSEPSVKRPVLKMDSDGRYQMSSEIRLKKQKEGWKLYPPGSDASLALPQKFVEVLKCFQTLATAEQAFSSGTNLLTTDYDEFSEIANKLLALRFLAEDIAPPDFEQPVFIVSAPRAGAALLFEALARCQNIWMVDNKGIDWIEIRAKLSPASDCLIDEDATPEIVSNLKRFITEHLVDRQSNMYGHFPLKTRPNRVRFLDQNLRHGLRIPFLQTVFPHARFVFVYRNPPESISSILAGWRSGKLVVHKNLPGWPLRRWSFPLPPGWQKMKPSSLSEVAAFQWTAINTRILDDLEALPENTRCLVRYTDLVAKPKDQIERVCAFVHFEWDADSISNPLPFSAGTLSEPFPDKWFKDKTEIDPVLPLTEKVVTRIDRWT